MPRQKLENLFLYRHRFGFGYFFLVILFVALLFSTPWITRESLSAAEIDSVETSVSLNFENLKETLKNPENLNLIDLPYHLLQNLSIKIFGLSAFSIKLPSILIALLLGLFIVLLLNRWFKNNVSFLASTLITLSTPFLSLASSGTPLIMIVFWPTFLLWLGSKIEGEKSPRLSYVFWFAVFLLISLFTPYMFYFALFSVLFVLFQPHLRFVVRSLPKSLLSIILIFLAIAIAVFLTVLVRNPTSLSALFAFASPGNYFENIWSAISVAFSWHGYTEGFFIAPLVSLPLLAIAIIGIFSTAKGFFASRNSIATLLLIFTLIISGFNPNAVVFILLPLSILVAHGVKYLLEKWYSLFPRNPYARVSGLIPLALLFGLTIIPSLEHYFYAYYYNPEVVYESSRTLTTLREKVLSSDIAASSSLELIASENPKFYENLTEKPFLSFISTASDLAVSSNPTPSADSDFLIYLQKPASEPENYSLFRLIPSTDRIESDIIYVYKRD